MSAKTKVVKFFIKNSPVGEIQDVLEDISNIIGHDFLQQEDVKQALREYFEHHKQHIILNDKREVTVSSQGR